MSPRPIAFALIGALLLALGTGVLGYFSGHYFATSAVADEQCPLYIDYSKPFCNELLNRLNAGRSLLLLGGCIMAVGAPLLTLALAMERPRLATRTPDPSGMRPPN